MTTDNKPWQQRLLNTVDANIAMFAGYDSDHGRAVHAELVAGRAAAVESFEGRLDWSDVPYRVREMALAMPEWGTRGT